MISVIIPTYNRENTILRSIQSVLNQTYKDIEVIIVDDCSIDNTELIIKGLNDERIKYIKLKENSGGAEARNVGIINSNGEFIAFQDSDDEWIEDKLEKQLKFMEANDVDLVGSKFYRIFNNKKYVIPSERILQNEINDLTLYKNIISTQTILAKKQVFLSENFDKNLPRFQDWELMIRITQKFKVMFMNEPLVKVYIQKDSITLNSVKAVKAMTIMLDKHKKLLDKNLKLKSFYYRLKGIYKVKNYEDPYNEFFLSYKYDKKNLKNCLYLILVKLKLTIILRLYHDKL